MASKEALEKVARIRKKHGKKSLPIRIMESDLYDWNPTKRMLLLAIALGTRTEKEDYSTTFIQEDCPRSAEEMVGFCDMAQWRLAGRVGITEGYVSELLLEFEKDGVVHIERWTDNNGTHHDMYQIIEAVIDEPGAEARDAALAPVQGEAHGQQRIVLACQPAGKEPRTCGRWTMKNSAQTIPTLSRRPSRHSAVSLRELSRRPSRRSAVIPYGNSAATIPTFNRWHTAEFPSKHGYTALIFQDRLNLSGLILQVGLFQHRHAASSAPGARGLADGCVRQRQIKSYRGLRP